MPGCDCSCHGAEIQRKKSIVQENAAASTVVVGAKSKASRNSHHREVEELYRMVSRVLVNLSNHFCAQDQALLNFLLNEIGSQRDMPVDHAGFLRLAVLSGDKWTTQSLAAKFPEVVDVARTPESLNAVSLAALLGDIDMVKTLARLGADVNAVVGPCQQSPIMLVVQSECVDVASMVACLLSLGADFNMQDKDGRNSLLLAAQAGNAAVVKLFLKQGLDISSVDKQGANALILAAKAGHAAVCELILANNPDMVDVVDDLDLRPLDYAIGEGHVEVIRTLVRAGSCVELEGRSPLQAAWHPDIRRVLQDILDLGDGQESSDQRSAAVVVPKDLRKKHKKKKGSTDAQRQGVPSVQQDCQLVLAKVDSCTQTEECAQLSQHKGKLFQALMATGKYDVYQIDASTGTIVTSSKQSGDDAPGTSFLDTVYEEDQGRVKLLLKADSWHGATDTLVVKDPADAVFALLPECLHATLRNVSDCTSASSALHLQYRRKNPNGFLELIDAQAVRENENALHIVECNATSEQCLREAVQELSTTMQLARVGGFLFGSDGVVRMISPVSAEDIGYLPQDLIGEHVYKTVAEADRDFLSSLIGTAGQQQPRQFCRLRADGSECWVEAQVRECRSLLLGDQVLYLSVEKECTEYRALASGAKVNKMFSGMLGDMLISYKHDMTIHTINGACERILGFKPSEMIGKNAYACMVEEDRERTKKTCAEIVARGPALLAATTIEYRKYKKGGGFVWLEGRAQIMEYDNSKGELSHVVVERDITERKIFEEERLRAKLFEDASPDMLVQTNSLGVITRVSAACVEVLGYKPEQLIGRRYVDTVHAEDGPRLQVLLDEVRSSMTGPRLEALLAGKPANYSRITGFYRFRRVRKDQTIVRIEAKYKLAPDQLSGGYSIYYIERDISARYKVLRQLRNVGQGEGKSITAALQTALTEALNRAAPSLSRIDAPVSDVTASDWSSEEDESSNCEDSNFPREVPATVNEFTEIITESLTRSPPMPASVVPMHATSPPVVDSDAHSDSSAHGAELPFPDDVACDSQHSKQMNGSGRPGRQQRWARPPHNNNNRGGRARGNNAKVNSMRQQAPPPMQVQLPLLLNPAYSIPPYIPMQYVPASVNAQISSGPAPQHYPPVYNRLVHSPSGHEYVVPHEQLGNSAMFMTFLPDG